MNRGETMRSDHATQARRPGRNPDRRRGAERNQLCDANYHNPNHGASAPTAGEAGAPLFSDDVAAARHTQRTRSVEGRP
jgi:hypothetical protein